MRFSLQHFFLLMLGVAIYLQSVQTMADRSQIAHLESWLRSEQADYDLLRRFANDEQHTKIARDVLAAFTWPYDYAELKRRHDALPRNEEIP